MKQLLIALTFLALTSVAANAQEMILTTNVEEDNSTFMPVMDTMETSDQLPFQQLIGYAIEVSSEAVSQSKAIGRYKCENVFPTDGYTVLADYPCEVIVHAEEGPIVVRYKNVSDEMDTQIAQFIKENQMDDTLRYNKGRFRFSIDEENEEAEEMAND